ncbi:helix-turn-helix transcriptional regulator, partial [Shigella flexneri]|nr:helix-turn-helix transcriptional regulator [Shigella flexneri]
PAVEQFEEQLKASVLLSELREREDYTQKELAELAGTSQSTVARIESGTMNVTFDTLAHIVNAMGYKLGYQKKDSLCHSQS